MKMILPIIDSSLNQFEDTKFKLYSNDELKVSLSKTKTRVDHCHPKTASEASLY